MGILDWLTGKPSMDKFAESLLAGLRAAGDTRSLQYDRENGCIVYDNGVMSLWAMHGDHCRIPRPRRQEHLRHLVRSMLPPPPLPEDFEDAAHDLRPRIWARRAMAKMNPDKLPPQHLVGSHLIATLVFDMPTSVRTITEDELEGWGKSYYEALEVAVSQLREDNFVFASAGDSIHFSATGDTYDASRLFLVDLIRKLSVKGTPIAMVPDRDNLLLSGSDDVEGLKMLLKLAEDAYRKTTRPLCPLPLCLDGDWWVDWMPDKSHLLYEEFRDFEVKVLYSDYEQQKGELQQKHGDSVFVATFSAAETTGDKLFSFSTWSKGVRTLLPRTQRLMFYDSDTEEVVADAPWEHVESVVGHFMKETDYYPARYLAEEFPTKSELVTVGNVGP